MFKKKESRERDTVNRLSEKIRNGKIDEAIRDFKKIPKTEENALFVYCKDVTTRQLSSSVIAPLAAVFAIIVVVLQNLLTALKVTIHNEVFLWGYFLITFSYIALHLMRNDIFSMRGQKRCFLVLSLFEIEKRSKV